MTHSYELLRQQAQTIEGMFKRMIDIPASSLARAIKNEIKDLIVDIRVQKNPRMLENRIIRIQQWLRECRSEDQIMRVDENMYLYKFCEEFRLTLRGLPNYQ